MKCDDCLMAYTAGGIVGRLRARRHARRCAACTEAIAQLEQLREELSRAPELSSAHRAAWLQAAEQSPLHVQPVSRSSRAGRQVRWALATGAVLFVAVCALWASFNEWRPAEVAVKQLGPVASQETTARPDLPKLRQLEQSLEELSQELRQLDRQAELLDARRELDRLSATYPPLGPTDKS